MLPTNPLLNATAPAGPHLPTATLRQYAAGTLAPAAQHRVEAHTLACPRCADILAGLLQTTPATTDQALAQLQQRLRHRVQQAAALPAARARQAPRWLTLQLAAAVALLLGLVAGGWWTWQQRHSPPASPRAAEARAGQALPAVAPAPQGGYPAWREAIRLKAAEFEPAQKPLSGAVRLRVLIGTDGKVQAIKVLRGLRADYDAEAQRLVREGPGWVPGSGGGKRAAQAVDIAVPF